MFEFQHCVFLQIRKIIVVEINKKFPLYFFDENKKIYQKIEKRSFIEK